ncbi:hypothetical protein [Rodentibacter mrazii]|nr:hypothetical protein [Rodentibacter mrazii]
MERQWLYLANMIYIKCGLKCNAQLPVVAKMNEKIKTEEKTCIDCSPVT